MTYRTLAPLYTPRPRRSPVRRSSPHQSRRVNEALIVVNGRCEALTNVYQALVPLTCGMCGRAIAEADCFTRKALGDYRVTHRTLSPVCQACQPWRMI